jgi:hypothetical protein
VSRNSKVTTQRDEGTLHRVAWSRCQVVARKGRPRLTVLVYRRDMPGRKRPTAEDAMTARRALLDGLARDADIAELLSEVAPLHPRNDTFPGEVFLHLAADALESCGASRAEPLPLEGLRERFLPEATFRAVPARGNLPRTAERQVPVRSAGRSICPRRDRAGSA